MSDRRSVQRGHVRLLPARVRQCGANIQIDLFTVNNIGSL